MILSPKIEFSVFLIIFGTYGGDGEEGKEGVVLRDFAFSGGYDAVFRSTFTKKITKSCRETPKIYKTSQYKQT